MKPDSYINCLEPGADNPKKHAPVPAPEPPEGFVDNTVKVFRLNPDGSKGELVRTMEAFPEGWDDPARRKMTPGSGRRDKEEDEDMGRPRREPPPVETLRALYEKYDAKIQPIAIELDATWMMACRWLREAGIIKQKQTPTPEPAAAANQEPERESQEPAGDSVAQGAPFDEAAFNPDKSEITVKDVLQYELAQREQGFGPEDDEPIPYQVVGKYEALGKAIGALVDEKNLQYGDAFNRGGCILEILYPDGVRPDQYRDMLGVIRVIDKLFRVANGKQGSEDPWQDIAGYGLLGTGE